MSAQQSIKISSKAFTVAGKRVGVRFSVGPWIAGVDASLIKVRPRKGSFPVEFRAAFTVENNSDSREDYFEADQIRFVEGHPLYEQIKVAALAA